MDIDAIKHRIKELIFETTNIKVEAIADTAHFVQDLKLDSLTLMEIGVSIDQEYGLDLPEEAFEGMINVQACLELVQKIKGA